MHSQFSTWYREVNAEPTDDILKSRWKGVEQLASDASKSSICDLARLAYQTLPDDDAYRDTFVAVFQESDSAFRVDDNEIEFAVLASAALASLMDAGTALGLHAALAIVAHSFGGARTNEVSPWLVGYAEQHLAACSASLRNSRSNTLPRIPQFKAHPKKELDEKKTANDWPGAVEELFSISNNTLQSLNKVSAAVTASLDHFRRNQMLYEEESDVLWWLLSKTSRDLNVSFDEIDSKCGALAAGKELADFTKILPGPLAIEAFLEAAIAEATKSGSKSAQIKTAINKTDKTWRELCTSDFDLALNGPFVPLHVACEKSCESKTWTEAFTTLVGLPSNLSVHLTKLGVQMYRERLFLRSCESDA